MLSHDAVKNAILQKEWDEASCPICMDHPHNAVLLLCSSHEKGCKSFICDTSYRHSNCLDRFKKLKPDENETPAPQPLSPINQNQPNDNQEPTIPEEMDADNLSQSISKMNLRCPMCRGSVIGYEVVEGAREYLNSKPRSCSRETCGFSGNYRELRRHARRIHPTARPSDIEPSREQEWRRIERQREYGDIVSAVRSAMPGAVVLGDYAIEGGGDRFSVGGGRNNGRIGSGEVSGPLLTTFFLFQMIGSMDRDMEQRGNRSRGLTRHRSSSTGAFSGRRLLWGENLLGLQDDEEENGDNDEEEEFHDANILSDMGEDASPPRRRRRLTRSRSDEDQS
jgi:hypothetical protein